LIAAITAHVSSVAIFFCILVREFFLSLTSLYYCRHFIPHKGRYHSLILEGALIARCASQVFAAPPAAGKYRKKAVQIDRRLMTHTLMNQRTIVASSVLNAPDELAQILPGHQTPEDRTRTESFYAGSARTFG
jgi:hypothetical protein